MVSGTLVSIDMGAGNLAICVLDMETKQIKHWFIIDIFRAESIATGRVVTSSSCTVDQHVEALVPAMDAVYDRFKGVTHVAIEQQPSGKGRFANNKMHNLQNALKVWFLTRCGICARIVSAKHKLKIIRAALKEDDLKCDPPPTTPRASKSATQKEKNRVANQRYAYYKRRAVQCARKLGATHATAEQLILFEASKKKDDYGDCFAQGLWVIEDMEMTKKKQAERERKAADKKDAAEKKQAERERKAAEKKEAAAKKQAERERKAAEKKLTTTRKRKVTHLSAGT